jgi:cardiolipin-specific phospholipase
MREDAEPPLVLLHGYCNGSLYFYRNFMGLSHHRFSRIYALDCYGWGLSSRPYFDMDQLQKATESTTTSHDDVTKKQVASAETFFVESLESWRKYNNLPKMILAGHSMGGYLSVAYAEKYPQHVERLILLSPVGVPEKKPEDDRILDSLPFYARGIFKTVRCMFEWGITPGAFLRSLPPSKSRSMVDSYISNRLPSIRCERERADLGEYLYQNSMLPGSGEYCLSNLLTSGAFARMPLVHRISDIESEDERGMEIHFIFGENDWMDHRGGIETQRLCYQKRLKVLKDRETSDDKIPLPPRVFVHGVRDAGHLLMLDNHDEFNAAVVIAAGGEDNLPSGFPRPIEFVCDEVIAAGDADLLPRGKREVFGEAAATQFFKRMRRFRNQAKEDVDVSLDEKKTEVA